MLAVVVFIEPQYMITAFGNNVLQFVRRNTPFSQAVGGKGCGGSILDKEQAISSIHPLLHCHALKPLHHISPSQPPSCSQSYLIC